MGISYNEYAQLIAAASPAVSSYTATGGSLSVAAGVPQRHQDEKTSESVYLPLEHF